MSSSEEYLDSLLRTLNGEQNKEEQLHVFHNVIESLKMQPQRKEENHAD